MGLFFSKVAYSRHDITLKDESHVLIITHLPCAVMLPSQEYVPAFSMHVGSNNLTSALGWLSCAGECVCRQKGDDSGSTILAIHGTSLCSLSINIGGILCHM
jgi:hypothetical protein